MEPSGQESSEISVHGNDRRDSYGMLWRLEVVIAIGCLLISLYSFQFLHSGAVLRIAAVGILIAGASLLTGCLLGFIFGIPRNNDKAKEDAGDSGGDSAGNGAAKQSTPSASMLNAVGPNSNLIEISDWLTKILVGVGLVELNSVPHKLHRLAQVLGPGLRTANCSSGPACADFVQSSQAAAIAIVIFFFAIGFLFGYVWTRLYFEGDLAKAVNHLWNKVVLLKSEKSVTKLSLQADALRNEGRLDEALKTVDRALKGNASDALAVFTKARILKAIANVRGEPLDLRRMHEAVVYAIKAAELMPGRAEPIYNLACYQALLGTDKVEVLRNLKKACDLNPALRTIAGSDPDFKSLFQDDEFKQLVSSS